MPVPRYWSTLSLKLLVRTFALTCLLVSPVAYAQTYTVLHNFTGGADGGNPYAGLTIDEAGNLYGTASSGGSNSNCINCGTVFKLVDHSGAWIFNTIYSFGGGLDGVAPYARVVFGPEGILYGTTVSGGRDEFGTVYKLQPPPNVCPSASCPWLESVLYSFGRYPDGQHPSRDDVVFDSAGNLYGATSSGGNNLTCDVNQPCGTVYELTHSAHGWNESVIYNFQGMNDGAFPNGVTFDSSGDLVGTNTFWQGNFTGTVFSLIPNGQGGWSERTLYDFSNGSNGEQPLAGVLSDGAGGFYGTTSYGGSGNGGTVWHLTSSSQMNLISSFTYSQPLGYPLPGSAAVLTMDASGNLYGTTAVDGTYNQGSVFKLTPSDGGWTLTTLYSFTGGSDGGQPWGQVILDSNGNIYGTANLGGPTIGQCYGDLGCGVIFEIAP